MLSRARAALAARRGKAGEDTAARYLQKLGWKILDRNWRYGRHELDLVCDDGEDIVFVEVRTRQTNGLVGPLESMTRTKRIAVMKAARLWLAGQEHMERSCRFDVIGVFADRDTFKPEHIRHAFEFDSSLGRGDAARQHG